jgi:CRP-like cAMP-binding protein
MVMELIDFIKSYVQVAPEVGLEKAITREELPKNYLLHKEGTVCRKLFFIQNGLARIFYFKDGKDITTSFVNQNTFTTAVDSFFEQKPSRYNIELLEASTVSSIKYDDLMALFKESHAIERFGRMITTEFLKSFAERLTAIQFQTAAERYQALQARYPDLLTRVALGHIASYLGITQETLSRLRGRKA